MNFSWRLGCCTLCMRGTCRACGAVMKQRAMRMHLLFRAPVCFSTHWSLHLATSSGHLAFIQCNGRDDRERHPAACECCSLILLISQDSAWVISIWQNTSCVWPSPSKLMFCSVGKPIVSRTLHFFDASFVTSGDHAFAQRICQFLGHSYDDAYNTGTIMIATTNPFHGSVIQYPMVLTIHPELFVPHM